MKVVYEVREGDRNYTPEDTRYKSTLFSTYSSQEDALAAAKQLIHSNKIVEIRLKKV